MRHQVGKLVSSCVRPCCSHSSSAIPQPSRSISIQATPSTTTPNIETTAPDSTSSASSPDARFEVLGSTSSLLSISLTASQNLFTRRGSLIGVSGQPENAISTLSVLSPLLRAPLGVPFLYQKVASTTPLSLLVATKAPHTSFAVVNMDGRQDWRVVQRNGLLAWTGHSMVVQATPDTKRGLAHWGSSTLTGRGLVAFTGAGQIYQVSLKTGEEYIAHPSNVLAYATSQTPPEPYRFKSTSIRLQIPSLSFLFPNTKFFRVMRETPTYKAFANTMLTMRSWTRRTIWGDRLFLRFHGPTTVLLQSRGSRLRDVLAARDVNEIADAPAGAVQSTYARGSSQSSNASTMSSGGSDAAIRAAQEPEKVAVTYANVGKDGKVKFEESSSI